MRDVILDSLIDSGKVFLIVIIFNFILSFFEEKISHTISKNNKWSPLIGSVFGLIPQCGFSVVASDMYVKRHITMGTLVAVFISCSDEAIPIMLSKPERIKDLILLIISKFILGFVLGYIIDIFASKNRKEVEDHSLECEHQETIHHGCCHHEIDNESGNKWQTHVLHPLWHSFKIFLYVLVINMIFGTLIYYIGEDKVMSFLSMNTYLSPIFAVIIGLIPNCASSVILTNLYLLDGISFGACLAGLICNAGLGTIYLFKSKKTAKEGLIVVGILVAVGLITGYLFMII